MRTIPLYDSVSADEAALTILSEKSGESKPAFIVFPGGAYAMLAAHEGLPVGEWFESVGVRAFVLKYRLGPKYHHPTMLNDAHQAIRLVRSRASEFGVDPKRVGILGFSAGGHLASTASTHFDKETRPDAAILIYPVISMLKPYAHEYSREMLLGKNSSDRDAEALSNYRNVSLETPPTLLVHGADDDAVPVQNSLLYAEALAEHRVPFELHVPQHGPHGFGLGTPGSAQDWRALGERWLRGRGF